MLRLSEVIHVIGIDTQMPPKLLLHCSAGLIDYGLMSQKTHYRSYRGQVFTGKLTQPTALKH